MQYPSSSQRLKPQRRPRVRCSETRSSISMWGRHGAGPTNRAATPGRLPAAAGRPGHARGDVRGHGVGASVDSELDDAVVRPAARSPTRSWSRRRAEAGHPSAMATCSRSGGRGPRRPERSGRRSHFLADDRPEGRRRRSCSRSYLPGRHRTSCALNGGGAFGRRGSWRSCCSD
jgi:hypothetical protein